MTKVTLLVPVYVTIELSADDMTPVETLGEQAFEMIAESHPEPHTLSCGIVRFATLPTAVDDKRVEHSHPVGGSR